MPRDRWYVLKLFPKMYLQIRTPYKVKYGKDLEEELKKALGGDLEDLAVALMQTPTKVDVLEIHRAVKVCIN